MYNQLMTNREKELVILTINHCAKMVSELGISMSPGALAAALERNAEIIATKIEKIIND